AQPVEVPVALTAYAVPVEVAPPDPRPSTKGLAIASMVLGIVADVFLFLFPFSVILGLIGLPMAGVSLRRISRGVVRPEGKGQAVAGLVTSAIPVAIA